MTETTHEHHTAPFVSVIVPVYNDAARIQTCIAALLAQTYPRDRYDVLVVDNGSTDDTRAVIERLPVTLLVEDSIKGSYAARNKGLAAARGDIIAFTDSDCTPLSNWLAEGVRALEEQQADLAGGYVRFVASRRPTGAEILDSISNMDMDASIRNNGTAKTANIFARRLVFDAIGLFPADVRSGGDVLWTKRATQAGHRLVYAPDAEVRHPTRRLAALLKKQYRVGKGQHAIRAHERAARAAVPQPTNAAASPKNGGGLKRKLVANLKGILPDPIALTRQSMQAHDVSITPLRLGRVWLAGWLARVATTAGNLSSGVSSRANKKVHVYAAK